MNFIYSRVFSFSSKIAFGCVSFCKRLFFAKMNAKPKLFSTSVIWGKLVKSVRHGSMVNRQWLAIVINHLAAFEPVIERHMSPPLAVPLLERERLARGLARLVLGRTGHP